MEAAVAEDVTHDRFSSRSAGKRQSSGPPITGSAAEQTDRAKAVCAVCTLRDACLEWAIATNQQDGVCGGCQKTSGEPCAAAANEGKAAVAVAGQRGRAAVETRQNASISSCVSRAAAAPR
ncbi:MAG: WhiB family transcriptional regulator [Egibacteraceae bacterium]